MRELVVESDRLKTPLRSARAQSKRIEDITDFVHLIVAPIQVTMLTTVRNNIVRLCANTLCLLDAMISWPNRSSMRRLTASACFATNRSKCPSSAAEAIASTVLEPAA